MLCRKLNLSTAYFDDLLRFETGKTLAEYFQFKCLYTAKKMLSEGGNTPAAVARLGYPSVQYFSLVFKKATELHRMNIDIHKIEMMQIE